MSLLEEFKARDKEKDSTWQPTHQDIAEDIGAMRVSYRIIDETRWGFIVEYVYQRGDEFVSVQHEDGNENVDPDYYPTFRAVRPEVVTVTKYVPIVEKTTPVDSGDTVLDFDFD